MSKGFEAYIDSGRKALEQLDSYIGVAKRVKGMVEGVWKGAKVYIFGSVVKEKYTAMSDIDILIVVDGINREEVYSVEAILYKTIEALIELHVTSNDEFKRWYKRFVDELKEIP